MVGLDIQDEMGRHEVGHIENSMKIPLNQGSGCRFEGEFIINKVSVTVLNVTKAVFSFKFTGHPGPCWTPLVLPAC